MLVIAVDTGNRCIKSAHADPFSAGLNRHGSTPPIVATDTLLYKGNYYSFSENQGYHRADKTSDDTYFLLTLAGIAREIVMKKAKEKAGPNVAISFADAMKAASRSHVGYREDIFLSVGLPPRDMKAMTARFKNYFLKDGANLLFSYNGIPFDVTICEINVAPQGFAATFPNDIFSQIIKVPQAYIIDIGGYTTDIARVVNRRIDTNFFESLDYGVIHMYNEIIGIVGKECSVNNVNGVLIEAALRGENIGSEKVSEVIRKAANAYAYKLVDALRDCGIDLVLSLPVLVGGGVQLLKEPLLEAIDRKDVFVVPDVKANAIGYEVLANRILKERQRG